MPYSVIVVDDEKVIRDGISKYINRFAPDFHVVATFRDGREVMEYLTTSHVNLIICDIKMADVSGIELSAFVSRCYPKIKMIVLSGFATFEYAQQLMKNNVSFYLVKPLENAQLLEALQGVKQKLDEEKLMDERILEHDSVIKELRRMFLTDLVFGELTDFSSPLHQAALSSFENPQAIHAAILHITWDKKFSDYWQCSENSVYSAIANFFFPDTSECFCTHLGANRFVLLSEKNCISELIAHLLQWASEIYKSTLQVQTEYLCTGIFALSDYLTKVRENPESQQSDKIFSQRLKLLISYICFNMRSEAKRMFSLILSKNKISPEELFLRLSQSAELTTDISLSKYMKLLDSSKQPPEEVFLVFMDDFIHSCNDKNELITRIKKYIHQNYMKNISLEELANVFYFHPSYLSRFFKLQTGVNFSDYLFDVRMIHATRLLSENKYKINEISKMVGYNNYRYFLKQFKKYTNFAPKSYRKVLFLDDVEEEELL